MQHGFAPEAQGAWRQLEDSAALVSSTGERTSILGCAIEISRCIEHHVSR